MPNTANFVVKPDAAKVMQSAFEAAWGHLRESGRVEAQPYKAGATREALALRIIEQAQAGLLEVEPLRDDALAFVLNVNAQSGLTNLSSHASN